MNMFNYIWKAQKLYIYYTLQQVIYYTLQQVRPLKYQFMFYVSIKKNT